MHSSTNGFCSNHKIYKECKTTYQSQRVFWHKLLSIFVKRTQAKTKLSPGIWKLKYFIFTILRENIYYNLFFLVNTNVLMNQYSIVHIINKAHLNLFVIFNCSQYKKSSFKACCKSPLTSEHVWIRTESHEYKKNTMSEILLQFYLFSFVCIKNMSNLHRSGYVEKIESF